ncbi:MAG: zinc ribbon domain-containing protein [Oscillospiraceae bacterium]|nr:zinc ribbon domain-containing protein [Oscillospiraceae bacterium]
MPEKRRCRVCGAELSATANVCPKCGAKQSRPLLAFLMVVAAIIILIVEMVIMSKSPNRAQQQPDSAAETSAVTVDGES